MMKNNFLRIINVQLIQKKFYHKECVRVRFAPSPTGQLHLGGLRTALYNYLFARQHNGSFLLRIEDTDRTRLDPTALEKLSENLTWAGIIADEDPIRGGPKGPYLQSKRLELYNEQVKVLIDNGTAYRCFCTERRLDLLRREAQKARQIPKYDNRCRELQKDEIKEKLDKGVAYCIRFKLSDKEQSFKDIVYGEVTHTLTEGDPIIMKSDGYPTYHFANVVDDHFMEISHVLRGVEWLNSTPKHIQLYDAFRWKPPYFAHLPLILNTDGTKLSKRQGDISVESFRNNGIFPLALVNYITLAGSGFRRDPSVLTCYSYEQLIKQFNVSMINENSSKLDPEKLLILNRQELCNLLENKVNAKLLAEKVRRLVIEKFPQQAADRSLQLDDEHILMVLNWARNRITKLQDLVTEDFAFLWVLSTRELNVDPDQISQLQMLEKELMQLNWNDLTREKINEYLRSFAKNNGVEFPKLMKLLRHQLSGLKKGPSVAEMMEILGKEKTLNRLNHHAESR